MAVRIKFDNTYNAIQPTLILATRSGRKLGYIPAVNISVSDNFNSYFELEFNVNQFDNGDEYELWDKLTDFKLVWCREWDVWFEIYVTVQDDNETVKSISAISLGEAELSQINLYNIEINTEDDIARDDYVPTVLYNEENPEGSLLNRIMEKAPHYSIKHVDSSIATLQRTFTFDGTSLYDALQDISEELNCIFIIDSGSKEDGSIARTISVYDLESNCLDCGHRDEFTGKCPECESTSISTGYGQDTTIFISTENLADEITFKTDNDSVKNCFRLETGDDLMTATVRLSNPNGSQYIWYFSDELKADMSEELANKLTSYSELYDYYYKEAPFSFTDDEDFETNILLNYNNLTSKYKEYDDKHIYGRYNSGGFALLVELYYQTIDFYLYLHDSFMPSPSMSDTTAELEIAKLTTDSLSPVAVQDLDKCSSTTASSAVLLMAKTIVDSRYQVKVKSSTFTGNEWIGHFSVTNYSDEDDTADSGSIIVLINDDYESFTKQKIEKILKNAEDDSDANDITSLFKLELSSFKTEVKKYCLTSLSSYADACQSCLDILIEQGIADKKTWADQNPDLYTELYLDYYNKSLALQEEIKLRESELDTISKLQNVIEVLITQIQDKLNLQTYLGEELWLELASYRREDTYSNDNYISDGLSNGELINRALEFIDAAKKEIYKSATLQHSLTASLKDLLVMEEFKPIIDKFSVGNWIRVKIDDNVYRLRLISYTIDFDDLDGLSVEFSDIKKCADGVSDTESIIKQATSMTTSYGAVTRQASQGEKGKSQLDDWVTNGLALTKMKIVDNADNQKVTWDSHGILCREYLPITDNFSDKQLKIINRGLYLTDDNWETSKAGIGDFTFYNPETGKMEEAYGVIADTLVGNLILSKKVGIYNTSGSVVIDENGFRIADNNNTISTFENDGTFSLANGNLVYDGKTLYFSGNGLSLDISGNASIEKLSSSISDESSRAQNSENALSTRIAANADGLSAEIARATSSEGSLSTRITANADELSAEVSRAMSSEDSLSTRISANAEGLELRVEKNGVISAINASSESVTISAGKINLNGAVTANNYFKINTDGSMECTNAKISGSVSATSFDIDGSTISIITKNITWGYEDVEKGDPVWNRYILSNAKTFAIQTAHVLTCDDVEFKHAHITEWAYAHRLSCNIFSGYLIKVLGIFTNEIRCRPETMSYSANACYVGPNINDGYSNLCKASSSSKRYKNIISEMGADEISALYDIPIHWFTYKDEYLSDTDERYNKKIPGFIVEDWEEIMPIAVDHNSDNEPEMWNNNIITPLMFEMIKDEHDEINKLMAEVEELKALINLK